MEMLARSRRCVADTLEVLAGLLAAGLAVGALLDLAELDAGVEVRGLLLRTSVELLLDDPLLETVKFYTHK